VPVFKKLCKAKGFSANPPNQESFLNENIRKPLTTEGFLILIGTTDKKWSFAGYGGIF
jgi:hypothetical protein